jgi:hypothetical protein
MCYAMYITEYCGGVIWEFTEECKQYENIVNVTFEYTRKYNSVRFYFQFSMEMLWKSITISCNDHNTYLSLYILKFSLL